MQANKILIEKTFFKTWVEHNGIEDQGENERAVKF